MNKVLLRFLAVGVVSALLCWAGGFVLPQSVALDAWPGVVLGLALFVAGVIDHRPARSFRPLSAILLIIFTVLGWRLAIEVGYAHGKPVPFVVAGALGAFCVAIGLMLAWQLRSRRTQFVFLVTAFGALGGFIFRFINAALGSDSDKAWALLLFLEWQTVLMLGIWLALYRYPGRSRKS